jgi:nicotinamidase-related amidase
MKLGAGDALLLVDLQRDFLPGGAPQGGVDRYQWRKTRCRYKADS